MIPEDHSCVIRGIIGGAEVKKIGQGGSLPHAGGRDGIHKTQLLVLVDIALQARGIDGFILPFRGATGLNDNGDIFRERDLQHLGEILCGTAVLAFQVAAAEIPVDGPGFLRLIIGGDGKRAQKGEGGDVNQKFFHRYLLSAEWAFFNHIILMGETQERRDKKTVSGPRKGRSARLQMRKKLLYW